MKILIKNLSNTLNYGSMMMGENLITYLIEKTKNYELEFYIDAQENFHIDRLKEATQYEKIYKDEQEQPKLLTQNIRLVRFLEKRIRSKSQLKKVVDYYNAIIILGGDDFAETYYNLPKDNVLIKTLFKDLEYLSKHLQVFMIGQTIGPYTNRRIKWVKKGLKGVTIYSRDDVSSRYVKDVLNKENKTSRDLAFLDLKLQNKFIKDRSNILKKYDLEENKYITIVGTGLTTQYTDNEDDMIDKFYMLIKKTKNKYPDYKLVWLSHVTSIDTKYNDNYILNKINKKYNDFINKNCVVINEVILPVEARIILGNGIMTVTCRMHAAVSTFQMGKPAICLSYSSKYKGVISAGLKSEDLVIEAKGNNLWETTIDDVVIEKIDYVFKNYDNLINRIKIQVEECKKTVNKTLDEIIERM